MATALAERAGEAPQAPAESGNKLLKPRMYKTDVAMLNTLSVDLVREEIRELRGELEADINRSHFKWQKGALDEIDYTPLAEEFYEFLNRSSLGEFSGCLLYADVFKRLDDPDVASLYKCMARDEGRHASFLAYVMKHMGRPFDFASLPKVEGLAYLHPKWIFITTYLSEAVGFYRYQNINDHMAANTEFRFHPLFTYFDEWCKDERRHARFFSLMVRSQPQFYKGWRNRLAVKFFTLAVYITMYLRDCESPIYGTMGIDWEAYDRKVIDETERSARNVWGIGIRTRSNFFIGCLRRMRANNVKNKATRAKRHPQLVQNVVIASRYLGNALEYLLLLAQPNERAAPLPRDRWNETVPDPGPPEPLRDRNAIPVSLDRTVVARRAEALPA
jgi:magnesium-protoporphyrin IX monomethyl ester (oxidative) cyclase